MKIETIHAMWEKDCEINRLDLTESSLQSPKIHQKYWEIMTAEKARLTMYEMQQKILLKKKWLYYNGKMSQEEIEAEGWEYDPFNGLKVLKGEMEYYYNSDTDIQQSEVKIQLQKQKIELIKDILDMIKWRHQTIRNIIEYEKFKAGY